MQLPLQPEDVCYASKVPIEINEYWDDEKKVPKFQKELAKPLTFEAFGGNAVIQQGRTRGDHNHKAFLTTSFLDRIQGLHLVQKSHVLELLLTGALFVEGGAPTLELAYFAIPKSSEELSTGNTVCPYQNRPLVALLRNL